MRKSIKMSKIRGHKWDMFWSRYAALWVIYSMGAAFLSVSTAMGIVY